MLSISYPSLALTRTNFLAEQCFFFFWNSKQCNFKHVGLQTKQRNNVQSTCKGLRKSGKFFLSCDPLWVMKGRGRNLPRNDPEQMMMFAAKKCETNRIRHHLLYLPVGDIWSKTRQEKLYSRELNDSKHI